MFQEGVTGQAGCSGNDLPLDFILPLQTHLGPVRFERNGVPEPIPAGRQLYFIPVSYHREAFRPEIDVNERALGVPGQRSSYRLLADQE